MEAFILIESTWGGKSSLRFRGWVWFILNISWDHICSKSLLSEEKAQSARNLKHIREICSNQISNIKSL